MSLTLAQAQAIALEYCDYGTTPNMVRFYRGNRTDIAKLLTEISTTLARYVDRPDRWSQDFIIQCARDLNSLTAFIIEHCLDI